MDATHAVTHYPKFNRSLAYRGRDPRIRSILLSFFFLASPRKVNSEALHMCELPRDGLSYEQILGQVLHMQGWI